MDATKPYRFIGSGAMDATKPYELIGSGATDATKPYRFIGSGAMDATKPDRFIGVAGFWKVFYIENWHFALDTLRVVNRSPTQASKINHFPGLFDDIWWARGRRSRPIWGIPGARAGIKNIYFE